MDGNEHGIGVGVQRAGVVEKRTGGMFEDVLRPLMQGGSITALLFLALVITFAAVYVIIRSVGNWWAAGHVDLRAESPMMTVILSGAGLLLIVVWIVRNAGDDRLIATNTATLVVVGLIGLAAFFAWHEVGVRIVLWVLSDVLALLTVMAAVAVDAGAWLTIYFFKMELTDSLRNSDTGYAVARLKNKWERERYYAERLEATPVQGDDEPPEFSLPEPDNKPREVARIVSVNQTKLARPADTSRRGPMGIIGYCKRLKKDIVVPHQTFEYLVNKVWTGERTFARSSWASDPTVTLTNWEAALDALNRMGVVDNVTRTLTTSPDEIMRKLGFDVSTTPPPPQPDTGRDIENP